MSKTNILAATALAAITVVMLSPSSSTAAPRGVDWTQRGWSPRWYDAQDAWRPGSDVGTDLSYFGTDYIGTDFDRGRCKYVGGPKSSIPCS